VVPCFYSETPDSDLTFHKMLAAGLCSLIYCKYFLMRKPEGRRPLGRLKRRWEDNAKMDLREIEWGGMVWIELS
jgi:hypothetical protein